MHVQHFGRPGLFLNVLWKQTLTWFDSARAAEMWKLYYKLSVMQRLTQTAQPDTCARVVLRRATLTSRCPRCCVTWRTVLWCSWTAGTCWWRRVLFSRRRAHRRSATCAPVCACACLNPLDWSGKQWVFALTVCVVVHVAIYCVYFCAVHKSGQPW